MSCDPPPQVIGLVYFYTTELNANERGTPFVSKHTGTQSIVYLKNICCGLQQMLTEAVKAVVVG